MAELKRIIIHWTGGAYRPNSIDKEHYHYLIGYQKEPEEKALIYEGRYKPEDNLNCDRTSRYAAHTGGGNTGSIGVALCAMYDYKNVTHIGPYPIKPVQMEMCYELCARLCRKYNIPILKSNVMTHYEFGKANPHTSSRGKPDIVYLSTHPSIPAPRIGDFIRGKIQWYFEKQI